MLASAIPLLRVKPQEIVSRPKYATHGGNDAFGRARQRKTGDNLDAMQENGCCFAALYGFAIALIMASSRWAQ